MQTPPKYNKSADLLAFSPDPEWDPAHVEISCIDVSKWERANKYVKVLSNVLTKTECADLIRQSEATGYEQAKVNVGYREILMPDVRNNDRCIIDSPLTMEFIWQRLVTLCGDDLNLLQASFLGKRGNSKVFHAVGLNERMRLLRYDPGTYFAPHNDGSYQRGYSAGERAGEQSFVTFQLYLNEGFDGGATNLLSGRRDGEGFAVIPRTGSVLLFQHDVYHEGAILNEGRKYALRTDVMYTTRGPGFEYAVEPVELP